MSPTEAIAAPPPQHTANPPAADAARDAAERSRAILEGMLEISNLVGSDLSLDNILARIVEINARATGLRTTTIYLWNEDKTRLVIRATTGLEPELVGKAGFDAGKGIPGWVAAHGEALALADGERDPRYDPLPSTIGDFHAYFCAPLRIQDEIIGVLTVRKNVIQEFTHDEITLYETICKQVAIVIEKARMSAARIEAEKLAAVAVSLSGVAHYIKNVLLAMRGGEYLIDSGIKRANMEQISEGWKVLRRASRKITDLVENMLNYYRDTKPHPRPIDLNSRILEILQNLEDRAIENGVVLSPDLDLRIEQVELDPDAFQDVMINLVSNAVESVPPGRKGFVRVQTRLDEEHGRVRIGVIDNGSGISPENRVKLFHLFFSTKGKKGTGIGLAATRRLILDHGGEIDCESEVDKGSEFIVTLPIKQMKV